MGLFTALRSIFAQGPLVCGHAGRAANADMTLEILNIANLQHALIAPAVLEELVDVPGGIEALPSLDYLMFGGAPLSQEVGDHISQAVKFQTILV